MKKSFILVILLAVSFFIATTGCKSHSERSPKEIAEYIVEELDDDLELSETQQMNMKSTVEQFITDTRGLKSEKSEIKMIVQEQFKKSSLDKNEVKSIIKERIFKIDSYVDRVSEMIVQMHSDLDEGQRAKVLEEILEKLDRRRAGILFR